MLPPNTYGLTRWPSLARVLGRSAAPEFPECLGPELGYFPSDETKSELVVRRLARILSPVDSLVRSEAEMGRQVGFFAIQKDLEDLLTKAHELGALVIPAAMDQDRLIPEAPITLSLLEASPCSIYLLPASLTAQDVLYEPVLTEPTRLKLMPDVSPAIQLKTGSQEGNALSEGRLFFGTNAQYPHHELAAKLYARLARHVRRWRKTTEYSFWVGPATEVMVERGLIHLRHLHRDLGLT